MNNLEIYKKTLGFSLRRIFWEFLSVVLLPGLSLLPDRAGSSGSVPDLRRCAAGSTGRQHQ